MVIVSRPPKRVHFGRGDMKDWRALRAGHIILRYMYITSVSRLAYRTGTMPVVVQTLRAR